MYRGSYLIWSPVKKQRARFRGRGGFARRQVEDAIVGENRGISEKEYTGLAASQNRFSALFTRTVGARVSLDSLDELAFRR